MLHKGNSYVTFNCLQIVVQFYGVTIVIKLRTIVICLALVCALTIPADARTIIVSNTNDEGPGSLRQALLDANDGDTIDATSCLRRHHTD